MEWAWEPSSVGGPTGGSGVARGRHDPTVSGDASGQLLHVMTILYFTSKGQPVWDSNGIAEPFRSAASGAATPAVDSGSRLSSSRDCSAVL